MSDDARDDQRLVELETRYTLQQDLLQQLSDVVAEQGREIQRLQQELERLKGRVSDAPPPFDPDERPPHY